MIINTEISEGEMPGMREAWPKDRGFIRVNFSIASLRNADTVA
jgi:hypothetical protein